MIFLRFLTKYYTRLIVLVLLLICVTFSVTNYKSNYMNTLEKIKNVDETDNTFIRVTSFPEYKTHRVCFDGKITKCKNKNLLGAKFTVYYSSDKVPSVNPGDVFEISGSVNIAEGKRNIGGFDSLNYGKSENNHGNIYAEKLSLYKKSDSYVGVSLCSLRQRFIKNADIHFNDKNSGVVKALVTGDKTSIYDADKDALQKSGVYHIVAISGLHLNIFIMVFANFIASLKIKRFKKAILSLIICTLAGFFVLIFTGFGLSVLRAFVMLVVFLGSSVFARKYSSKNSLFVSAATILICIPSSFYSVGFALSVLSTLGVLISADIVKRLAGYNRFKSFASLSVTGVFITSVVCNLLTLPVTMESFGYAPLYSPIANFIILPLMAPALGGCVIFGGLSVLGFSASAKLLSYPTGILITLITGSARFISELPFSTMNLYPAYTQGIIICVFALGFFIFFFIRRKRIAALFTSIILCVALTGNFLYNNYRSDAKVVFADVGQGECTIAVFPQGESVMFDFGTNTDIYYTESDIRSTLIKLNVPRISAAFISHFHKDHTSGLINIVQSGLVKKVYIPKYFDTKNSESMFYYRQLMAACENSGTEIIKTAAGSDIKLNNAHIKILYPDGTIIAKDANEMSAVAKLTYGNTSFLFTGDISKEAVKELCTKNIKCDVLKVPHHGSKTSANDTFIKKASPDYAVISCSENNTYGHPHDITLDILNKNSVEIYRTDKMGAVIFNINKERIKSIETMR